MRITLLVFISLLFVSALWAQSDWTASSNQWYRANAVSIAAGSRSSSNDTLYIAESDTLKKSTDGGATWNPTGTIITSPLVVACNPKCPNELIVGTHDTLKRSTNGGTTFTAVLTTINDPLSLAYATYDTSIIFAGYYAVDIDHSCLYKSTNGGSSWVADTHYYHINSSHINMNIHQIATFHGSDGLNYDIVVGDNAGISLGAGTHLQGLYYSCNNDNDWNTGGAYSLTSTSDKLFGVGAFDISGKTVYAGFKTGALKKNIIPFSSQWTTITLPNSVDTIYNIQTSHDTVYLATDDGIYRVIGTSYTRLTSSTIYTSMWSLALGASNSGKLYCAGDSSAYAGTNLGSSWSWSSIVPGLMAVEVSSVQPYGNYRGAVSLSYKTYGFTHCTTTVDEPFHDLSTAQGFIGRYVQLNPGSPQYVYASGSKNNKSHLFISDDTGKSWSLSLNTTVSSSSYRGTVVDPAYSTYVYVFGDNTTSSNYAENTNHGISGNWYAKKIDLASLTVYSMAIDSNNSVPTSRSIIGYAGVQAYGTSHGGVYKSTNLNASAPYWKRWSHGGHETRNIYSVALNPTFFTTVYAGGDPVSGDAYGMFCSLDSGNTWNSITSRTDTVKRILIDPQRLAISDSSKYVFVLACATGGTDKIYRTSDGGASWTDVTGSLPTPIYDLRSDPSDNTVIYVATKKGVFQANRPTPTLTSPADMAHVRYHNSYPFLCWSSVSGATSYRVQVASDANFNTILKNETMTNTSYEFYSSCNQTYYWRVYAANTFGESAWSAVRSFTTDLKPDPPPQTNPAANDTGQMPCFTQLQWDLTVDGAKFADYVHLQASTDSTLGSPNILDTNVVIDSYTLASLTPGEIVFWRIAGHVCTGDGNFSPWRKFTVNPTTSGPDAVSLTSPSDGVTGIDRDVRFYWGDVSGFTIDTIQVSTTSNFSNIVRQFTNTTGDHTYYIGLANPLSSNTWYYWRVKAYNCYGTSTSCTFSFQTGSSVSCGNCQGVSHFVKAGQPNIPEQTQLFQNYPNPFNPTTTIMYALKEDGTVTLNVYNVLGQQVAQLVNEFQNAGYHEIEFNSNNLPSGVYFYRLNSGLITETKKMFILK